MRQIGSIDNDAHAERFSDYLVAQGIENMVEESAGPGSAWSIWIENDDLLDRARAELQQFRANPEDARYAAATQAREIRKQAEKSEQRRREKFIDVRTRWSQPSHYAKPVTIFLVAASLLVGALTRLGMTHEVTPAEDALLIAPVETADTGDTSLEAIRHGQVWRLVTSIFIHYGPFHLLFNMLWTVSLGVMIEQRRGSWRLLGMVIAIAAISNLSQYYFGDWGHPNPRSGGMSGVVYGLFGYAWLVGRLRPELGIGMSQQNVILMMVWLVLCMIPSVTPVPNVANVAHVVGLLCGVAFAVVPYGVARARRRLR